MFVMHEYPEGTLITQRPLSLSCTWDSDDPTVAAVVISFGDDCGVESYLLGGSLNDNLFFFSCFEIRQHQGPPTDTAGHVGPIHGGFVWGHQGSYWSHIQRGDLDRRKEPGPHQDRRHLRSCGAGHERRAGERRRVCCCWGSDSCGFCRCQQSSDRRQQKEGQVRLM